MQSTPLPPISAQISVKPYKTLKSVLVHPKDKQEKEDWTERVYTVPCANCDKTYIGETGRKFRVRLQEHRTEVESKTGRTFTRSLRASSLTEHNKCALTDHATQENHVINWSQATVIDREPERFTRWIKEAIHIRKEGRTTGHEPWWRQLPTEPRIRPLSWHGVFPSCQEPEKLTTSVFWWRPLIEVETSSFR